MVLFCFIFFIFRADTGLFLFNLIFENFILHMLVIIIIIIRWSGMFHVPGFIDALFGRHYLLVFHCFLSNCQLATFHKEVQDRRYRFFLEHKLTKLERGSQ